MMYEQVTAPAAARRSATKLGRSSLSASARTMRGTEEERLEIVDLSGMFLDTLPNPSLNLGAICKLDLSNNNLQVIPESLAARLLNVVVLDLRSNQLKSLPNSIGCLSKLKVLNVSGNLIENLPKTMENCRALEEVNANFNKLSQLPEGMGEGMGELRKLSVNSNKLAFLPASLPRLAALRVLDARLNCLRALPDDLGALSNLETLNVSQNFRYLHALPASLGLLPSLLDLDASYNAISALPPSLACLPRLRTLCLEGNPLVSPPPDVLDHGLHAVKEYLSRQLRSGGASPKKKSWVGRLVKYGTFNGKISRFGLRGGGGGSEERRREVEGEGFIMSPYRSIDGLASPRYLGMFSPRRLFSPRTYFTR